MAEKQSGPLKPPTLDMQARKPSPRTPSKATEAPKSAPEDAKPASETPKPGATAPHRPAASRPAPASAPFPLIPTAISAVTGAAIAVLIILGLATTGMLAGLMPQATGDQAERLTFAEEQVSEALVGFNALNRQLTDLQNRLDSAVTRTDNNVDLLTARQDQLETSINDLPAPPTSEPIDLTGIQTRIDQLDTRIAALQSGASPAEADSITDDIADLRANLTTLSAQVADLETNVAELGEGLTATSQGLLSESGVITSLQADIEALKSEPALASSDTQLLRLPLALSGLETALEAASPFSAELQSLLALVPDLSASENLTAAAETGLPAPGRIVTDFARTMPAIMAARPTDPDARMMDSLMARAQALLAIRPTGETGTDPVSDNLARAETALANRQFVPAAVALAELPEPMQNAAGDTLTAINLMAEAERLLADARASVLAASDTAAVPNDGAAE